MENTWSPIEINYKEIRENKNIIFDIIKGKKPALIIRNFYDPKLCKIIIKRTKSFSDNTKDNKILKKIGVSLLSFLTHKSDYFKQADAVRPILRKIFDGIEDPRKKIHCLLSEFYPNKNVIVATEGDKKYACGVIRFHNLGDFAQIHRDCVQYEAPNFDVAKMSNQLSSVLHIQDSKNGGELVIYKKIWKKTDEKYREISFGYSKKVLEGCSESVIIKPRQGDLVIINPIYFHEILPVKGNKSRITLGLFLAFSKYSHNVVTWS
jgi:hypothetical protein